MPKDGKKKQTPEVSAQGAPPPPAKPKLKSNGKLKRSYYESELAKLHAELVHLQEWVRSQGLKVVVLFEGRDAAGKGSVIKRITERVSPRTFRVVALTTPTEREKSQWYFQRYVTHLPAAGEVVLFDRSWYNRAGVEHVMNFCTEDQYQEFLRSCPQFEQMLMLSGVQIIKYWFSVSDEVQEQRFQARIHDPTKSWKLSPMDLKSRVKWVEYSKAKDEMFKYTDTSFAPWYVVDADDKRRARLNTIRHLLSLIPYKPKPEKSIKLPEKQKNEGYHRPPKSSQRYVPNCY